MPKNFKTPHGLEIRLDLSFFMGIITGEHKAYSSAELICNPVLSSMVLAVEHRWQIPSMLKWLFTLFSLIFLSENEVLVYSVIALSLGMIGIVWRITVPNTFLDIAINFLVYIYSIVCKLWFVPYCILFIVGIITTNYSILIAFFIISALNSILCIYVNGCIIRRTSKKYGMGFSDSELVAFATFYVLLNRIEGLGNFIYSYCEYVNIIEVQEGNAE